MLWLYPINGRRSRDPFIFLSSLLDHHQQHQHHHLHHRGLLRLSQALGMTHDWRRALHPHHTATAIRGRSPSGQAKEILIDFIDRTSFHSISALPACCLLPSIIIQVFKVSVLLLLAAAATISSTTSVLRFCTAPTSLSLIHAVWDY